MRRNDGRTGHAPPRDRPQSPFRSREFRVYWTGGLISNVGTWLENVCGSVVILQLTHSPFLVGVLNVATFGPLFLLSIVGGMISDRYNRRAVLVIMYGVSGLAAGVIAMLSAAGQLTAFSLIGCTLVLGAANAVIKPAYTALLPATVPGGDIAHATAINTLQFNIGQVGGSAFSAALLSVASPTWAFALNAVSFVGPIASTLMLRIAPQDRSSSIRGSGKKGLRFAFANRTILVILLAIVLSNAAMECLRTLAPSIATRSLHGEASSAGLLVLAYSLGGTAGILSFGQLTRRVTAPRLLVVSFVLQIVGLCGLAVSTNISEGMVSALPVGLGFSFNLPILSGALQSLSPDAFRGRVMALFAMCMFGLRPIFSLSAGGLADVVAPAVVLAVFIAFPLIALRLSGSIGRALVRSRTAVPTVGSAVVPGSDG